MLALSGYPFGFQFRFFDTTPDAVAGHLAELQVGDYANQDALKKFAEGLDVVSYEWENVPLEAVKFLETLVPVYPPSAALEAGQDRFTEKSFLRDLGIQTPPFFAVDPLNDLNMAAGKTGLPAVLKTRRMGYDGKGQMLIKTESDLEIAWTEMGKVPLILEGFVSFEREVSSLAARGKNGEIVYYPLTENHHEKGILKKSIAPAPNLAPAMQEKANANAKLILEKLQYVGLLAIEWFVQSDDLIANEIAPRVHNSGHWSIEGAQTSQFENHIRAISGLPLGSTNLRGVSTMTNLIGEQPDFAEVLATGAHLHWYGKSVKPGRKVGHITRVK